MTIELVDCAKYHARLSVGACVARYRRATEGNETWGNSGGHGDPGCRICEIGRQRAAGAPQQQTPRRGRPPKAVAAAGKDIAMTEITIRCSRCKTEKPLDAFNNNARNTHRHGKQNFCRDCQKGIDGARDRKAPKPKPEEQKETRRTRGEARPMDPHDFMGRNDFRKMMDAPACPVTVAPPVLSAPMQNCIVLDFTGYPELEEFVRDLARDEFRRPEEQVLYIIKQAQYQEAANA